MNRTPSSDLDLFTEAAILDPYPGYAELRAIGPAVWLTQHDMWCVPQFDAVKRVLGDYRTFTTAKGVAMEAAVNGATSGPGKANSLTSDPPLHDEIRRITGAPLTPKALRTVEGEIKAVAQALVADLCKRREVDGMVDVAQHLPLNIVTELVGLPKDAEQNMLKWAAATFNAMGPMNDLCKAALPQIAEQHAFCNDPDMPSRLRSGGWADRIFQAAGRGDVALSACSGMMREYIGPALDTTIFGTGHLLRLLALNPDQWALLKKERSLVPSAVNEALRMESPIKSFTRYVRQTTVFGAAEVQAGDRVIVLYGSANRDEAKWGNPEVFDVSRGARDQIAFGYGIHSCAGMHLARMEMAALLEALLEQVDRFEVGEPVVSMNNTLRGFERMPMVFHPV